MKIRNAEHIDIKELVKLGRLFYDATILPKYAPYDDATMEGLLSSMIDSETSTVIILEKDGLIIGGIMGLIQPVYWNASVSAGQQLGYFVNPSYRGFHSLRLLDAFETWAKGKGASVVASGAKLSNNFEEMDDMLRRKGYQPLEMAYIKGGN